jgi:hypothetical protein
VAAGPARHFVLVEAGTVGNQQHLKGVRCRYRGAPGGKVALLGQAGTVVASCLAEGEVEPLLRREDLQFAQK